MCGIAGIVRLSGRAPLRPGILQRMADALVHRGPDDDGYAESDGVGLANRRLSIVGLDDGKQPARNEAGDVVAIFNGELFDYREIKQRLQSRGHRFSTNCDTELIPHLWDEYQERMFEHMHGQFAFALHDRRRRQLLLARDRFGICPLYWSRQTSSDSEWLLFASEIKALLASGLVVPRPDLRGIDQAFHFFAVPGPATCFAGVQALQPAHYLLIDLARERAAPLVERTYWSMEFPDRAHARDENDRAILKEFEESLLSAVEHRLRADVPVVAYVSGGIDSSIIAAMSARVRGEPTPSFTVQVASPGLDETREAGLVARHTGSQPTVVRVTPQDVVHTYPELIRAAEAPVIDTAAAATLMLAREVHSQGFKVALAGEGSDEWLGGYPWHKIHRLIEFADVVPGVQISHQVRRLVCSAIGVPAHGTEALLDLRRQLGHHSAFHDVYGLMTASRYLFFRPDTLAALENHNPYLELKPNLDRMRRWHPIDQSAYWAGRIHLPGHLLSLKGDRPAMRSSVETRYPFLDERVFAFLASLHPRWKLRGVQDKYILRRVGERYLPREIAWRRKMMFRAPLDVFFSRESGAAAPYVEQLLSPDALRTTGWFSGPEVALWKKRIREGRTSRAQRTMVQLGMVGVLTSQLWYHTFIASLADVPRLSLQPSGLQDRQLLPDRAAATSAPAINPA